MIWKQIGERIVKIRKHQKLSRTQFGQMIGVSSQCIGMIERGVQGISVNVIVKICNLTGTSADYILFGIVDSTQLSTTSTALSGLSNEQIQITLDIIKKVAQFVNTESGNEALIREVLSQQRNNFKTI